MAESYFRRLMELVKQAYPAAAERVGADSIGTANWRIGRVEALELKAPPYVALIRGSATHRSPRNAGPIQADGQSVDPLTDTTQVLTAIICGRDEAETELLWYAVLGAVRDVFGMSPLLFGTATWMTQEEGFAGYIHAGAEVVVQEINLSIRIPLRVDALTTITATEHDCEGIVP